MEQVKSHAMTWSHAMTMTIIVRLALPGYPGRLPELAPEWR